MSEFKFTICGKEVDLARALPLVARDFIKLEEQGFVTTPDASNAFKRAFTFVSYVIRKACPELTEDELLDTLEPNGEAFQTVLGWLTDGIPKPDRPPAAVS